MKPILFAGSLIVSFALIAYSIGVITEQRKKIVTRTTLIFLSVGLTLDISGTACMLIGSTNSLFTYHGIIGYSALLAMFFDTVLMWGIKRNKGINAPVSQSIHKYSLTAYTWWIFAYISGFLMSVQR
ncbi:MAG: hypothetical protein JW894_10040 [Bacteroidales bacterium]|nr:hypothetical protein [Bacteroidales bacterium]